MRKNVRSFKIEFESTVVIKCGWEIRLTIITCLGEKMQGIRANMLAHQVYLL